MHDIVQLKITLLHTDPPIWRRLLVETEASFLELHYIIQIAMGWESRHLFEFRVGDHRFQEFREDMDPPEDKGITDALEVSLGQILSGRKQEFTYEYDFGDGWRHQVEVEKFLPSDDEVAYPFCIEGQLNCPPEDCGGVPGFYRMLKILGNKRHPERKEMLEWLGDDYDPKYFNPDEVNEELQDFQNYLLGGEEDDDWDEEAEWEEGEEWEEDDDWEEDDGWTEEDREVDNATDADEDDWENGNTRDDDPEDKR